MNNAHSFEYLEWIVNARNYVEQVKIEDNEDYIRARDLISNNLKTLLPQVPEDQQERFAKMVKFNQMWAAKDQGELDLIQSSIITDPNRVLDRARQGKSFIFCTFHLASYRLINTILGREKVPFALLTDQEFIETQGQKAIDTFRRAYEQHHGALKEDLEILNAENDKVGLQLIRRVKAGKSIVVYLDGNTGVGGFYRDPGALIKVPFFDQMLYARKGASFVSHVTDAPLVPVLGYRRDWLTREFVFLDQLQKEDCEDRESYCERTVRHLFSLLEQYLLKHPSQWEGWFYVHKFLEGYREHKEEVVGGKYSFIEGAKYIRNEEEYPLISALGKKVLFNKNNNKVVDFTDRLECISEHFESPNIIEDETHVGDFIFTKEALIELVEEGVLIEYKEQDKHQSVSSHHDAEESSFKTNS